MIITKWIIKVYFDNEKKKLLFEKNYNSVKDILKDFKGLKRDFLYDCCKNERYGFTNKISRKFKSLEKYRKLEIIKTTFKKDGSSKTSLFSLN